MSSLPSDLTPAVLATLSTYPAIPPPPGVKSNFVNPENQNKPLFVVTSLLLGFMGLLLLNRFYNKTFINRKYSWDDLTLLLGVIGSIAYYIACIWGAQRGKLGVHEWDINIPETASLDLLIPAYLISVLTPPTFLFIKTTFFLMYIQIFRPLRWLRINAYIGMTFTILFYSIMTIAVLIFTTPSRGETWFSHQTTHRERLSLLQSVPQSAIGLAIDIYILVLPIVAVSKLQLPTRRKVGVILLFMTGLLACISSLLSIYYRNVLTHSPDVTWTLMPVNTVTLTEMFVGIIVACMPSAAHTFRHHLHTYNALKKSFQTHVSALRTTRRFTSQSSTVVNRSHEETEMVQGRRAYAKLDHYMLPTSVDHDQNNGVRTSIRGQRLDDNAPKAGIHLNYELQSVSQQDGV